MGKYNDPEFGAMDVRAFTRMVPPPTLPTIEPGSVFDSLVLQIRLDFYHYGTPDSTEQVFQVFEILDTLGINGAIYTSASDINIGATPIGEDRLYVYPPDFVLYEQAFADNDTTNDRSLKLRFNLTGPLGQELFDDLMNYQNEDLITNPDRFLEKYKGFAIVASQGDKILGALTTFTGIFSNSKDSRVTMYYHDSNTNRATHFLLSDAYNSTAQAEFTALSFTTIDVDRSGTVLSGIQSFTDFTPSNGKLYLQGCTGLAIKLDFTPFYQAVDTLKNPAFQSAQLIMQNISTLRPPSALIIRTLNGANRFRPPYLDSTTVKRIYFPELTSANLKRPGDPYFGSNLNAWVVGASSNPVVDIRNDNSLGSFAINSTSLVINDIFITQWCQFAFNTRTNPRRATTFAVIPVDDEFRKSVSSIILNNQVKLRLYYAEPVIKIQ